MDNHKIERLKMLLRRQRPPRRHLAALLSMIFILFTILLASCSTQEPERIQQEAVLEDSAMTIQLQSSAFEEGAQIPRVYTCDGDDISPPLTWTGLPEGTVSTALIMDDPDAPSGIWVHWLLYDIPAGTTGLAESIQKSGELPGGGNQGSNSSRRSGYGGPCPPGGTHRYFFKLYALDSFLDLKAGATKAELLQAIEGHILAQGQLMGTYSRSR